MDHPDVTEVIDGAIGKIVAAGRNPGAVANDDDVESKIEKGVKFMMTSWTTWAASGAQEFSRKVESASS
jgi:2-keto-3-deoxy-L-rhamnonate aldolase RhmA